MFSTAATETPKRVMQLRFRLFLQEHPDGSFTAQLVDAPDVRHHEATRAAAIQAVQEEVLQELSSSPYPRRRRPIPRDLYQEAQQLLPLEVPLIPRRGLQADPIIITVSLLVTEMHHPRHPRWIVTAPRISGFMLVLPDDDELPAKAREGLIRFTRKWDPQEILDADQEGVESLETLCIDLPDPEAEDETDEGSDNDSSALSARPRERSFIDRPVMPGRPIPLPPGADDSILHGVGANLTEQAANGRLGRADRRDTLVERVIAVLASEHQRSVMLVGPPAVGKTALMHEVVARIGEGRVPDALNQRDVWHVTANNLISGHRTVGDWQAIIQQLLRELREGKQILVMGDPYAIAVAGRWSGSDNNMSRFLRGYIESGEISVVCETTPEGFASTARLEPSFMHAFVRIDVPPTDEPDTLAILQAAARRVEVARNLRVTTDALQAVLDLTRRFLPYRAFPGKAAAFLETMTRDALPTGEQAATPRTLDRGDAITSFTAMTGLPKFLLSDTLPMRVDEVRNFFEQRLLGQPEAVGAMVELITVIKAGLNDPHKPLGSFFFVGPTGVGKTEAAKVLAEFLFSSRERMVRFDMSEYAAEDALPRLIGSAWRPEDEGELTRRVREQPFCVLLLDELEKAHPKIFDALLGVLGEGRLTDAQGQTVDFRNAIIIMTSNLGAHRKAMRPPGFDTRTPASDDGDEQLQAHFEKQAEGFFRPEFYNRIDRVVAFRALTPEAIERITRRELGKLLMREGIVRRNLLVEIDDAVIALLAARGFDPQYGARPLQREIERALIVPLAQAVVARSGGDGHLLRFSVRDNRISLSFVVVDAPETGAETSEPSPDRRLEHDLNAVVRTLAELQAHLAGEEATPITRRLRDEMSALLVHTHAPTFWDDPAAAKNVLGRIYHLERVLKRLDAVRDRAETLQERAHQIRRHRDKRSVPELARDVGRLESELSYVQIELAGAGAGGQHDHALVRVQGIGRESGDWADELLAMYRAWAGRKDYEYTEVGIVEDNDDRAGNLPAAGSLLLLHGPGVYDVLRGEAGIHRLDRGTEARVRSLARVTVLAAPEPHEASDPAQAALAHLLTARVGDQDGDGGIVRVYREGRQRFVKDPHTGVRVNDLHAVLREGQIDSFLLARLRQFAAVDADTALF